MKRTTNALRNTLISFGSFIVIFLFGIAIRRLFLDNLSIEYLGYEGLFSNIFAVLSTLDLALTKLPKDNALAYLRIGRLASDLKCYEVAEKAFREVLQLYPKRMIAQLYLVESLIGADKLEEAEACLKKLPMNNEFSALVHKLMGDIYHQRKQFRMAVEEYRATILSIPELAQEHASLIEEADNDQNDDWESLAETYQPSLTNTVTEQAERMRGNRARRRDQ